MEKQADKVNNEKQQADPLEEALHKAGVSVDIHKGPDDPAFEKNNLPDPQEKDEEPSDADDSGE